MGNLGNVFEKRLEQLGLKKRLDASMICEAFDTAILEVFGEPGQKNVHAISYKNNILKVGVMSSSWASEINLKQLELLDGKKMRIIYKTGSQEDLL